MISRTFENDFSGNIIIGQTHFFNCHFRPGVTITSPEVLNNFIYVNNCSFKSDCTIYSNMNNCEFSEQRSLIVKASQSQLFKFNNIHIEGFIQSINIDTDCILIFSNDPKITIRSNYCGIRCLRKSIISFIGNNDLSVIAPKSCGIIFSDTGMRIVNTEKVEITTEEGLNFFKAFGEIDLHSKLELFFSRFEANQNFKIQSDNSSFKIISNSTRTNIKINKAHSKIGKVKFANTISMYGTKKEMNKFVAMIIRNS